MTPVIRHLPLAPRREFDPENMTPAEISAWLNARDRQIWLQRLNYIVNFSIGAVAVLSAFTLYQFFTR